MSEDVDRVARVRTCDLVERAHPVAHRRARGAVHDRMAAMKHEVAHVHDVGALEGDHGVAARVGPSVMARHDALVTHVGGPEVRERGVRVERLGCVVGARLLRAGRTPHVLIGHPVGDHHACDTTKDGIARGVVAVMVRVDQHVHAAVVRPRLKPVEQRARLGGKLRVDDGDAARMHQPADGSTPHREGTDVAADGREDRIRRGTRSRECRTGGPQRDAERGGRRGDEKIAAG